MQLHLDSDFTERVNARFFERTRASPFMAQDSPASGRAAIDRMAEAFRSGAMKDIQSLFLGGCPAASPAAGAAPESGTSGVEIMAEAFRSGAMKDIQSLFLGEHGTPSLEEQASPAPEKGMEDSMAYGSGIIQNSRPQFPGAAKEARVEAQGSPEPEKRTEDLMSGGIMETSNPGRPGSARAASLETLAPAAGGSPGPGVSSGIGEPSGQNGKGALADAGHDPEDRQDARGKGASSGMPCPKPPQAAGMQADQKAGGCLSDASCRDDGPALEPEQGQPAAGKNPADQGMSAGGSLLGGAGQPFAVPSAIHESEAVRGERYMLAPSGCAVIWNRSDDSDKYVLLRASRAELEGIVEAGDRFAAFAKPYWLNVQACVKPRRVNLIQGAYVSRRQHDLWDKAAGYLAEFSPMKAVSSAA